MPVILPDFDSTHQQCAPYISKATLKALVKKESGFSPLAIGINKGFSLQRQPTSKEEAIVTAKKLMEDGYNFDAGWFQINVANIRRLNLSFDDVFDACKNMRISADMFKDNYYRALAIYKSPEAATLAAISAHNTGNFTGGFKNGYVQSVAAMAIKFQNEEVTQSAPALSKTPTQKPKEKRPSSPQAIPKFEITQERSSTKPDNKPQNS